jgi:hypothetical protein
MIKHRYCNALNLTSATIESFFCLEILVDS